MYSTLLKSVIFDSNIWISFFLKTDIFHYEAIRIIEKFEKRKYKIYIPSIVLFEIITVLTKKGIDINQTKKIINHIQSTNKYDIYSIDREELLELALKHACQIKLKSLDYLIFLHYVKLNPRNFITFDANLLKYINLYKNP